MDMATVYPEQSDLDHLLCPPFPSKKVCACGALNSQALPACLGTTFELLHNYPSLCSYF